VTGPELVRHWMSEGALAVPPDASLRAVCEAMVAHQIHRICVTEGAKLVGLITSFDVVRHIAHGTSGPSVSRKSAGEPAAVRRTPRKRATR
jgi:CBS domain-containing protein